MDSRVSNFTRMERLYLSDLGEHEGEIIAREFLYLVW